MGQIDIQRGTQTQISELKQPRRRRQRQRKKEFKVKIGKTTTLHVHHFHSLPPLHDYDVKIPNFTFSGECEKKTTSLFSFPDHLHYSLLEFNSRKNCQHLTN